VQNYFWLFCPVLAFIPVLSVFIVKYAPQLSCIIICNHAMNEQPNDDYQEDATKCTGLFSSISSIGQFSFSPVKHNYTLCIIHNVILHIYRYIEQRLCSLCTKLLNIIF